jgi:hypothetical protein
MNKKFINILLIGAVVFIWGFIVFKMIKHSEFSSINDIDSKEYFVDNHFKVLTDTFTIEANYRNPFEPSGLNLHTVVNAQSTIKPIITEEKHMVKWPDINYFGLIENNKAGAQFGLISVNNKKIVIKQDDEVYDLKIISIYLDSIKVRLENEIKTIIKM